MLSLPAMAMLMLDPLIVEVDSHELGSFLGPMRMWGMKKEKEKIRSEGVVHDQREEVLKAQFSCRTSRRAPDLGVQALPAPASHQRIAGCYRWSN